MGLLQQMVPNFTFLYLKDANNLELLEEDLQKSMNLEATQPNKFWNVYWSMTVLQVESAAKLFWIQFIIMSVSVQAIMKNTEQ